MEDDVQDADGDKALMQTIADQMITSGGVTVPAPATVTAPPAPPAG